jgi:hypothetical protein
MTIPQKAVDATRVAQILSLVKDNQMLTAIVVFLLWQAGAIAQAATVIGGVC